MVYHDNQECPHPAWHRLVGETLLGDGVDPADETVLLDYQYDNPAHVHAVSKIKANGAEYNFGYDPNGNMETSPDLTELGQVTDRTIQYDGDNMPVRIVKGTISVDFTYDGLGRRVKKTISGGATTLYISDHYEVKDGIVTKYIFGGNLRLAVVKGTNTYYYHKDHLGSTAAVTDAVGNKSEGTEYLPFGSMREHTGSNVSDYKFTDQEADVETNLYNYDARLYDPVLGMFVTPDSIVQDMFDPQYLNRYTYCRNNPLIYTDPSGHGTGLSRPGGSDENVNGKGGLQPSGPHEGSWEEHYGLGDPKFSEKESRIPGYIGTPQTEDEKWRDIIKGLGGYYAPDLAPGTPLTPEVDGLGIWKDYLVSNLPINPEEVENWDGLSPEDPNFEGWDQVVDPRTFAGFSQIIGKHTDKVPNIEAEHSADIGGFLSGLADAINRACKGKLVDLRGVGFAFCEDKRGIYRGLDKKKSR